MAIEIPSTQNNTGSTNVSRGIDFNRNQKYNFNYLVFPQDLGMMDNGHYMVININVPTNLTDDGYRGNPNIRSEFGVTGLDNVVRSKVDQLRFGGVGNVSGATNSPLFSIQRRTRRIQDSIALYMPRPLIYNTQNVYEDISLTALAGRLGIAASDFAKGMGAAFKGKIAGALNIGAALAGGVGSALSNRTARAVSQVALTPINPSVEILFSNTTVRNFVFEFLLAPRNEEESLAIKKIIQTIRFHAAPELGGAGINYEGFSGAGLTWIPPAEFDITFYNKGVENLNILRINTCVLDRIEVDYSPTGVYSTFTNGHPVATRLSLAFREVEPIHKLRVLQGF